MINENFKTKLHSFILENLSNIKKKIEYEYYYVNNKGEYYAKVFQPNEFQSRVFNTCIESISYVDIWLAKS